MLINQYLGNTCANFYQAIAFHAVFQNAEYCRWLRRANADIIAFFDSLARRMPDAEDDERADGVACASSRVRAAPPA